MFSTKPEFDFPAVDRNITSDTQKYERVQYETQKRWDKHLKTNNIVSKWAIIMAIFHWQSYSPICGHVNYQRGVRGEIRNVTYVIRSVAYSGDIQHQYPDIPTKKGAHSVHIQPMIP